MAATSFKLTSHDGSDEARSWPRRILTKTTARNGSVMSELGYNEDTTIMKHLKQKRSRALASLTRKRNTIVPLLTDDAENLHAVNTLLQEYYEVFDKFCNANDAYDNVIQDEDEKNN